VERRRHLSSKRRDPRFMA